MTHAILLNRLRGELRFVIESILTLEGGQGESPFEQGVMAGQLIELRLQRQWLADLLEEIERTEGDAVTLRLLLIACLAVGYMRYVSPFLVDGGAEWIVMGGWFFVVVPAIHLIVRLP